MFDSMNGYAGHWFGGGFMWIFWIVLIVLVIWIVQGSLGNNNTPKGENALEILKKRYAKGEIDKVEYDRMRKELEQ